MGVPGAGGEAKMGNGRDLKEGRMLPASIADVPLQSSASDQMQSPIEEVSIPIQPTLSQRILYMVTVLCELSDDHNQGNKRKQQHLESLDGILHQLSDNIRSMMESPFNYEVDVYWILGCRWEEVLGEDANVWESYLQDQLLSNGVGLEVWEDAMPLDYEQTSLGPAGGNQRHLGEDAQSLDVQK